jgi:hypothetical protein
MTRGVLYLVWGQIDELLNRSIESVERVHPELPIQVCRLHDEATLLDKAEMYDLSPFDETLFLDADTVVLSRLDHGFHQAKKHDLACCICECPWGNRYPSITGDLVEYNTGVLFFQRSQKCKQLFDTWKRIAAEVDSSIEWTSRDGNHRMPLNDQASFAIACYENNFNPFVLPLNWNLRPKWHKTWFGSVRIWHDYEDAPQRCSDRKPMEFFRID